MTEIFGLPQPLTGAELVTIHQMQNGQLVLCTMPLSELATILTSSSTAWATGLPATAPSTAGVVWNNNGVISVSQ
jgi:hypothetical protein